MLTLKILTFLIIFANSNRAHNSQSCLDSTVKSVKNFDIDKYLGTWFVHQEWIYGFPANETIKLSYFSEEVYSLGVNKDILVLNSRYMPADSESKTFREISWKMKINESNPARWEDYQNLDEIFEDEQEGDSHQVIGTDYETWSLGYNCKKLNGNFGILKILTVRGRSRHLTSHQLTVIEKIIRNETPFESTPEGLKSKHLVEHNHCPA